MKRSAFEKAVISALERLGHLIRHGVPLGKALDTTMIDSSPDIDKEAHERLEILLGRLKNGIEQGKSFTESLRASGVFPDPVLEHIVTAENRGTLDEILAQLVELLSKRSIPLIDPDISPAVVSGPDPMIDIATRLDRLLVKAVQTGASDLHIDPIRSGGAQIRLRIDGVLHPEAQGFSSDEAGMIVSRIKKLAELDIAERRRPQDGRIRIEIARAPGGKPEPIDLRVSVCPYINGEKVVIRFLDCRSFPSDFEYIGLPTDRIETLDRWLKAPYGMVLVSGPTGSGKTTTLYLMLSRIARSGKDNILSIEDPVEYILDGVHQMQVHPSIGLTFAAGLRSMLRQDPDVIGIGEIPDVDTARMAVQMALTGHVVFTQLHAPDGVASIKLMYDLGIPAFKLRESIIGVVSQRLVRKLCRACRAPLTLEEIELLPDDLRTSEATMYGARGCEACHGIGYRGRLVVMELLEPDSLFWKALDRGAEADELRGLLPAQRLSLREHGVRLAREGSTSPAEIARVLG